MLPDIIELTPTEVMLSFASSCVEGVARRLGVSYQQVFSRMKKVDLMNKYIIPYYDVLHTESREHVIDNVIEALNTWEAAK